jgi:hypothetical protein
MTHMTSPPPSMQSRRAPSQSRVEQVVDRGCARPSRNRSVRSEHTSLARVRGRRGLDTLGRYTNTTGREREVIAGRRGDGCVLVVDRDALTLGDRRLVAQLAADEPPQNAALVCAHYLRDAERGRCREVTVEDLIGGPRCEEEQAKLAYEIDLLGQRENVYRLDPSPTEAAAMELRWRRHSRRGALAVSRIVCLRDVVGALESYEPACGLTRTALARYYEDASVATAVLRGELERLRESPVVLNGKLRQAVLAAVERDGLSLSEIAIRCGRVKRDSKGSMSGETSWLARRVGLLPESGASEPTPWVHTDVLALIARTGLGISPHEVELG